MWYVYSCKNCHSQKVCLFKKMYVFVGTFPVVALMVGNAVTRISSLDTVCDDGTVNITNTSINDTTTSTSDECYQNECEILAVDIAVTLSFLVGIIMVST